MRACSPEGRGVVHRPAQLARKPVEVVKIEDVMAIEVVSCGGKPIHLWTKRDEVEDQAFAQLSNVAALPWVFHHVAAMPDVHFGVGATVGSVVAMRDAVAPAAVGVDIGCGMGAVKTNLRAGDLPDSLRKIRSDIEAAIPVG